jgi:hypothetical protein
LGLKEVQKQYREDNPKSEHEEYEYNIECQYYYQRVEIIETIDYFINKLTNIGVNIPEKKTLMGYHSVFDTNRLEELYDVFVEKKYIHPDSNRKSFKAIFVKSELPEDFEPPIWIEEVKLLAYLYTKSNFKTYENEDKKVKWLDFPKLFKNEDGKDFKYDTLKSSKHDNRLAPPKKADELKKIIESYSVIK